MWSLQEILFPITSYEMSVELQMQVSRPDTKLCPFSPILNRAYAVVYVPNIVIKILHLHRCLKLNKVTVL